jgi:ABC-2 type transport system ATP-binding protein
VIELFGLTKRYGALTALNDLTLAVPEGEVFGFLGPNGAGKTTTIRIMAGLIPPTSGRALIGGRDIATDPMGAKALVGFIPDRPFLFDRLTGREFLRFSGRLFGMAEKALAEGAERWLAFFDLADWGNHLVEGYSHGMQKRLVMAAALLHGPRVLIVDEPMVGLDPQGARKVRELFIRLAREEKVTVFLTTHELATAEAVCSRIGILHKGRLIALGTLAELAGRARAEGSHLEEVFLKITMEGDDSPAV